jgi:hypothetical protein
MAERLECRNISRNSLHRVLQRHEILDRSAGAIEKERGEHLLHPEGLRGGLEPAGLQVRFACQRLGSMSPVARFRSLFES